MHSLTGPVGQPFASRLGRQQDVPTLTMELGSPVSDVSLHYHIRIKWSNNGLNIYSIGVLKQRHCWNNCCCSLDLKFKKHNCIVLMKFSSRPPRLFWPIF
jgi:hypothetical protein